MPGSRPAESRESAGDRNYEPVTSYPEGGTSESHHAHGGNQNNTRYRSMSSASGIATLLISASSTSMSTINSRSHSTNVANRAAVHHALLTGTPRSVGDASRPAGEGPSHDAERRILATRPQGRSRRTRRRASGASPSPTTRRPACQSRAAGTGAPTPACRRRRCSADRQSTTDAERVPVRSGHRN